MNPAAQQPGRLGGLAKSAAKTAAVCENAKPGGWPKGKPRKPKRLRRRAGWSKLAASALRGIGRGINRK